MNLLAIDFSYFFEDPTINQNPDDQEKDLYNWERTELIFDHHGTEMLWHIRARNFLIRNKEIPFCTGYETFWDRFTIPATTPIYVANFKHQTKTLDIPTGEPWNQIDFYGAHHNAEYHRMHPRLDSGTWLFPHQLIRWMFKHHYNGTKHLNAHYPPWRDNINGSDHSPINRRIDPGSTVTTHYDTVLVTRSSAWVPAWCDHQFQEFIDLAPNPITWDDRPVTPRPFNIEIAERQAATFNLRKPHAND